MFELPFRLDIQQPLAVGIATGVMSAGFIWLWRSYSTGSPIARFIVNYGILRRLMNANPKLTLDQLEVLLRRTIIMLCIMFGTMSVVSLAFGIGLVRDKARPPRNPQFERAFQQWKNQKNQDLMPRP